MARRNARRPGARRPRPPGHHGLVRFKRGAILLKQTIQCTIT